MKSQYYLESGQYVPDRLMEKIDKTKSSMMENGLYQFYLDFAAYRQKLNRRIPTNQEDDDLQALTMEQLERPLVRILCIWSVAMIIFILEFIKMKWSCRTST